MSKTPTPIFTSSYELVKGSFNTLSEHFGIVLAPNQTARKDLRNKLISLLSRSDINDLLDSFSLRPPHPETISPELSKELQSMKDSILALSKTMEDLQPSTQAKAKSSHPSPPVHQGTTSFTYAKAAAAQARPVSSGPFGNFASRPLLLRLSSVSIRDHLNAALPASFVNQVQLSAVKWTEKGNLVLTAGPGVSGLSSAVPILSKALFAFFAYDDCHPFQIFGLMSNGHAS